MHRIQAFFRLGNVQETHFYLSKTLMADLTAFYRLVVISNGICMPYFGNLPFEIQILNIFKNGPICKNARIRRMGKIVDMTLNAHKSNSF